MLNERIKIYIETKGLKLNKLSDITGVPHGSLSDIKNGKREPGAKILEKLIRNTDINAHWLLTGEGPMIRPQSWASANDKPMTDSRDAPEPNPEVGHMIGLVRAVMESDNEAVKVALRSSFVAIELAVKESQEVGKLRQDIETLKKIVRPAKPVTEVKER